LLIKARRLQVCRRISKEAGGFLYEAPMVPLTNLPEDSMNRTAITLWSLALLAFLAWPASAQETFYFSDFESDDGGWVLTSAPPYDSWEHGTVVPGVHEGCDSTPTVEPAGAHSGTNVWATNLDGCYPNTTPT